MKRNPGPVVLPILGRKLNPEEPGIPIDVSRANMFDTTYVHPRLRNSMILWEYYTYYIKLLLWFCSGATAGMDQWIGKMSAERHHPSKIFFNKSMKVCPDISKPYRPATPGPQLWHYALRSALIQTPISDVGPSNKQGAVRFIDNGRLEYHRIKNEVVRPDMIVYCTGYQQKFTFLESLDGQAFETRPITEITNVRSIWNRAEPTMGFIGFVRPSLGAIPPLAALQAQLWVLHPLAPRRIPQPLRPEDDPHYRLLSNLDARVTYGLDHESYAYQLALDMGSAPGLWDICNITYHANTTKAWRLRIVWAFGAHFTTKFRLVSPWYWDKAAARPLFFGKIPARVLKSSED
ncbi:hypothetical protein B0I35DRAFT_455422 [Stachybotrys elegans]|uniref:Uncharacterized protein n=1 Tax=Stachybotrys elegans TaxID=80388 RepID=A0A8K0SC15_9HYPO|nr:hypothetical protein B0I35DRAFT_455422 [Stachybotrys elegans]